MSTLVPVANPTSVNQAIPGVFTHPEYDFHIEEWEKIRDVVGGSKMVKARGQRYLPGLSEQEPEEYNKYRGRALFFNATRRTRDAVVGLLLRKTPAITLPDDIQKKTADVDLAGSTLNDYLRTAAEDLASISRGGTFVDWSEKEARPYFAYYRAEDIIDWEETRIDGRMVLSHLVLRENRWERSSNEATRAHEYVQIFRTYKMVNGVVEATERRSVNSAAPEEKPLEFKRKGKALEFIPFVFHSPKGNCAAVQPAAMSDIADINISHYQSSADLEQGRHVCGIPTPWAAGFETNTKLVLGTSHAWVTENAQAQAGFIEFTGAGLTYLENALKEKQEQMAALGARMLEVKSADAEAFETVQLRSNAEQASLVAFSEALSATITRALQFFAWWEGSATAKVADFEETCVLVLSTDFVGQKLSAQQLTALVAALQAGALSYDAFYYNLEQGEMFPENWTQEDEERSREQTPPAMPPAPGPGTGGGKKPAAGE